MDNTNDDMPKLPPELTGEPIPEPKTGAAEKMKAFGDAYRGVGGLAEDYEWTDDMQRAAERSMEERLAAAREGREPDEAILEAGKVQKLHPQIGVGSGPSPDVADPGTTKLPPRLGGIHGHTGGFHAPPGASPTPRSYARARINSVEINMIRQQWVIDAKCFGCSSKIRLDWSPSMNPTAAPANISDIDEVFYSAYHTMSAMAHTCPSCSGNLRYDSNMERFWVNVVHNP